MNAGGWLGLALVAVLACAVSVAMSTRATGDFACTLDARDTLYIEDVDSVRLDGDTWRVNVEAGFYLYMPRKGELCAVMP